MNRDMTRRLLFAIILSGFAFIALAVGACSADEDQRVPDAKQSAQESKESPAKKLFRSISREEARSMMATKDDLLVVDVRTPQERKQVRLAGSQLVPIGDVLRGRFEVPKEQPLLIVCAVGGRSYIVSKALIAMGHQEIYNLEGGIEAWWRAGYPVETGIENEKSTERK